MMKKLILSAAAIASFTFAQAQSPAEKLNRTVLNRIEYFFNTQQTDSIYALATDDFQKFMPASQFGLAINYFYQFGKIKDITPATFINNVAGYNLTFDKQVASIYLGVDSTYKFNYFTIKSEVIPTQQRETIESNVTTTNALDAKIDSLAQNYLKRNNTPGMAIGIIHNNRINEFYYGRTDKNNDKALPTAHTLFEIGSLTKIFTATILADLVQKEVISLDDSIAKFLPDSVAANPYIQKITFKSLANHTSGLPRLPENLATAPKYQANNPYQTYSRKELYAFLKDVNSLYEPGDNYEYSNLGYALLGDLLTTITKKPYPTLVKELITVPLGMPNTTDKIDPKKQAISKAYDIQGNEVPLWSWQSFLPAGGLKSNMADLLRFAQYQFKMPETDIENAMALTRLFTYYLPPSTDIGLAWHMNMVNDVIQYWHTGATAGHASFIGLIPDQRSAIVILSNSEHALDVFAQEVLTTLNTIK